MIKIMFFAQLREQLNCSEKELYIEEPVSIEKLLARLVKENPMWQPYLVSDKLLAAVNQTMVSRAFTVSPTDEVAFFPPVTGG